MKLARRRKPSINVPTSSMGDIAFLLIIFFIVTSTFMQEAHVKLKPAASRDIKSMKEATISVTMDEVGVLRLQGLECRVETLDSAVTALLMDRTDKTVMLKVHKTLTEKQYGPVFMALSRAGADIALVGTQIKDQD
jgi:biopolymer transport protein ExbD